MLGIFKLVLVLAPLAVVADHTVTFVNNCGQTVKPVYHDNGKTVTLAALGKGGRTTYNVPEAQLAWRAFGQTGACTMPDGAHCTLLECSFDNPNFRQCNLSRVDGFNIGVAFAWSGCSGNSCPNSGCGPSQAFSTPTNGGASLRQCNTKNVPMTVTFCP